MKNKYISPDLEFIELHMQEDILSGSGGTTEEYDDADMDSDELFD